MRAPITLRGAEKLRAELRRLKSEDRPAIIRAIAEARSHGDLSENAEYHAAREQQGFIEGRIKEIELRLSEAQVIDPASLPATGKVVFGATVDLAPVDGGPEVSYQIVGDDEADIRAGTRLDQLADCACTHRQVAWRRSRSAAPGGNRSFEVLNVRLS